MNVLVPLPFDLSLIAHGRNLRIVHLLNEVGRHGALTCLVPDVERAEAARSVLPDVRIVTAGAAPANGPRTNESRLLRRAFGFFGVDERLMAEVRRRSDAADVVLGFDLPSVVYLRAAADRGSPRTPIVCDLIDDPWLTCRALPLTSRLSPTGIKTALCVRLIRDRVLCDVDALAAVAAQDAAALARAAGRDVAVIPNGVDVARRPQSDRETEPLVVFTGAMNFPPNEAAACHFVRRIWPHVQRRSTDIRFAIVGANPTPKVQRLSEVPGVNVTGRVDDLVAWLERARVAVAPMVSGSGMKNKVLEACAAGCPVVATSSGAAGLPTGRAHGITVAESPIAFAEEVAGLAADPSAAAAMGRAAWDMVRERFSWPRAAEQLLALLHRVPRTRDQEVLSRAAS